MHESKWVPANVAVQLCELFAAHSAVRMGADVVGRFSGSAAGRRRGNIRPDLRCPTLPMSSRHSVPDPLRCLAFESVQSYTSCQS